MAVPRLSTDGIPILDKVSQVGGEELLRSQAIPPDLPTDRADNLLSLLTTGRYCWSIEVPLPGQPLDLGHVRFPVSGAR